jgi:putative PEP-CTERM system histidine kinase
VQVVPFTHLAAAVGYLALSLLLLVHSRRAAPVLALVAACAATGAWALAAGLAGGRAPLAPVAAVLDLVRLVAWLGFLVAALRAGRPSAAAREPARIAIVALAILGPGLLALEGVRASGGELGFAAGVAARLALAIAGIVCVEALYRQARGAAAWRVRYLCLGAGAILLHELVLWSDALLFRRVDSLLDGSRGAVGLVALPLVAVAAARNAAWSTDLRLARRAVLHGAVLVAVGAYLVALAAAGEVLRRSGVEWGRLLAPALLLAGLVGLALVVSSRPTRLRIREALARYLFTHRHDYREQWRRFDTALAGSAGDANLAARSLDALADLVGSSSAGLWLCERGEFRRVALLGDPAPSPSAFRSERLAEELARGDAAILAVAGAPRGSPDGKDREWLPAWLRAWPGSWLLVPLVAGDGPTGMAVLGWTPRAGGLPAEDEELLRSAAHRTATALAAERAARELDEGRRFQEISRRSTFLAHDLRNLANELGIALANARRHIHRPEFQREMLATMESSVAEMQRLLDKLAERAPAPPPAAATDFRDLLRRSLAARLVASARVRLEFEGDEPILVAADPDRLASMSGHLVQNAIEAAGPSGHVTVRLMRSGASSVFEVEDDGPGMSAETVQERLRRPFGSSKRGGLGVGLHECRELARELGGELAIDSEPGRGTIARLLLPASPAAPAD